MTVRKPLTSALGMFAICVFLINLVAVFLHITSGSFLILPLPILAATAMLWLMITNRRTYFPRFFNAPED